MRVLLKISWEALKWEKEFGIDENQVKEVCEMIKSIKKEWFEIAVVVWWWNIYRGSNLISAWVNPTDSHNLSMLSTVFNGVILKNFLEKIWINSIVFDCNDVKFCDKYNKDNALRSIKSWNIVILTWWTWNPYFTTDSGWVLRALELNCDFMIKATKVDWVYDKDPMKYSDAVFFKEISYDEVIKWDLKFMDQTAISLAKSWNLKLKVVNIFKKWSVLKACLSDEEGSLIK